MELVLIDPNSPEWEYMWGWLEAHPINEGVENPSEALNEGEAWQYMGSFKKGQRIVHEFRHRKHPAIGKNKKLSVAGSESFTVEQIKKTIKLK